MSARIGLIGCGIVTIKAHIPALMNDPSENINNPGFVITALCGKDQDKLNYIINKLPHAKVFSDYKELIDSNMCDAVLVATGEHSHLEIADYALEKGLFVFIEKPVSDSIEIIQNFLINHNSKLKKIQVGFNKRFYPGFLKYRELKKDDQITEIVGGSIYFLTQQGKKPGKEGVLSNLIHMCDIICWIFGEPIDVHAHFSKILNDNLKGKTVTGSILTNTGAVISFLFSSSSNWNIPYHENIEIIDIDKNRLSIRNSNEVIFSKYIDHNKTENITYNSSNSIFWNKDVFGYKSQITEFYHLVTGKTKEPFADIYSAFTAHKLFDNIFQYDKKELP